MLHPASTHFAIVLPLVASVFGIIYLFVKTEAASKIYARTTLVAAIAMVVAWYTGSQAGPEIYNYLSESGQATLVSHKGLGLNLAIAMSIIAVIVMISCKLNKYVVQVATVVALLALSAATLYQGKIGGELVYKHGTPFKSFLIMDSLNEAAISAEEEDEDEAKLEVYQDAVDDIAMHVEEIDAYYGIGAVESEEEMETEDDK
jgi:uncharacterized membrane protein